MRDLEFQAAGLQSKGPRRFQNDAYFISAHFIAVADGAGDWFDSARAALIVTDTYQVTAQASPNGLWMPAAPKTAVDHLVADNIDAASTISAVELSPEGNLWCSNVGDSKTLVVRRDGGANRVLYSSPLHNEAAEGLDHPMARHTLTQSIWRHQMSVQPTLDRIQVQPGDVVIVTTDGVHEVVLETDLTDLALAGEPSDAVS